VPFVADGLSELLLRAVEAGAQGFLLKAITQRLL
jgi:hypothetical protein